MRRGLETSFRRDILRVRWLAVLGCLFGVLALGVTACGGDDNGGGGGEVSGENLTIYSSLPLQGSARPQNLAVINGAKIALKQRNNKVGKFTIDYKPLDDATAQAGKWDPGATSANARKAAQDDKTIAYMGEFNSGASAISIPILNEAGIPQVSPANTAVGLTVKEPGADKGEPGKYYPTGKRTYARTPPRDTIQGAALAVVMKDDGCKQLYILNDKEVYGLGVANNTENSAKTQGIKVVANDGIDPKAPNYRSLASKIKDSGADCFFFGGITQNNAVQLYKDVAAATVATLSKEEYEKRHIPARRFFDLYQKTYGVSDPDPYAIFGYETMSVILDAIKRAGDKGNDRDEVLKQIFATNRPDSVLGKYSIDNNGDTTLTDYGVYKIAGGKLAFQRTVEAEK